MEGSSDSEPSSPPAGVEWVFEEEVDDHAQILDGGTASTDSADLERDWQSEEAQQPWLSVPSTSQVEASAVGPVQAGDTAAAAAEAAAPRVQLPAALRVEGTATAAPQATAAPRLAAPAIKRPTSRPARPNPQSKKQRRNYGGHTLSADQVEALMGQDLAPRPRILDSAATAQAEGGGWIFKETGKAIRPADPRADKWRRGGGASGAATGAGNFFSKILPFPP